MLAITFQYKHCIRNNKLWKSYDDLQEFADAVKNGDEEIEDIPIESMKASDIYDDADENMQDCIDLAGKVGDSLADKEVVHCVQDVNFFKNKYLANGTANGTVPTTPTSALASDDTTTTTTSTSTSDTGTGNTPASDTTTTSTSDTGNGNTPASDTGTNGTPSDDTTTTSTSDTGNGNTPASDTGTNGNLLMIPLPLLPPIRAHLQIPERLVHQLPMVHQLPVMLNKTI